MAVVVSSDGKFKPFLFDDEVPKKVLAAYDWLDEDDKRYGWVKYKNEYMRPSDFERLSGSELGRDWDGGHAYGFSSGVLIKLKANGEEYKLGFYRQEDDDYKPKRGEKVYYRD